MREETVARRYASAFLDVSAKHGDMIGARDNIRLVADTVSADGRLNALLHTPQVPRERKSAALAESLKGRVSPATLAFLNLLTEKRRITLVPEIADEVERLVRERQNVARATAVSAEPLLPAQRDALKSALEHKTGKTIELTTEIDPTLLGGVLVRIGDTVMDGSVRGKLDRLREQLMAR